MNWKLLLLLTISAGPCAHAQEKARAEVLRLKTQYINAVDRQVAPLQDKYLGELKRLKETYTKAGDLDSALLVNEELKKESKNIELPKQSLPANSDELKSLLMKFQWIPLGKENEKYRFEADGTITIENSKARPFYKITGPRSLTMIWSANRDDEGIPCLVTEDCTAINERAGARTVWTRGQE